MLMCRLRTRAFKLDLVDTFDERADALWEDASSGYQVISRRDATWLRWRFDQPPVREEYRRYYLSDGERVIGYLVLRPTNWNDQPVLAIIDYLAAPRRLAALFGCAVMEARRRGVTVLHCQTRNRRARRTLHTLGFVSRTSNTRFVVLVPDGDPGRETVLNPDNWFLTVADSDLDPTSRSSSG
jgi:hypothetical protein